MVASSKVSYEDDRKKRVEENKKRMEELNLTKLALNIRPNTPKPSPAKKQRVARQPLDLTAVRRSGRNADKPPRSYKEEPMEPLGRAGRRGYRCSSGPRNLSSRANVSQEDRVYAQEKADYLQSILEPEFPSFVKPMLHSHVIQGFWLGLPVDFCNKHLPKHDEYIDLVDEDGNITTAKYLAEKRGLSGGWRGFALDHEIADGDACVFQLIKPTEFKVYIIRFNQPEDEENLEETD